MSKPRKAVPDFADEAAEPVFWETHDTADHVDWSTARAVRLPNLKPSTTAISLRLPVALLKHIKLVANQHDVPYQSLIKLWLAEKVEGGRDRAASKR
ncbi:MAG: BrnA antitoxin family protein [Geminicoccaceae bacterium]